MRVTPQAPPEGFGAGGEGGKVAIVPVPSLVACNGFQGAIATSWLRGGLPLGRHKLDAESAPSQRQ